MPEDRQGEEAIFCAALEIPDPAERQRHLDEVCAGLPDLRDRIERLLSAEERSVRLLGNDPVNLHALGGDALSIPPIREGPGAVIGRYKILEQIGEGGFGVVYMAEQQEPVRRTVALKIIKPGMDSRQVLARFEAERQALALMDHPSISRVLDAGSTEAGRPYFVMELVRGIPITKFCSDHHVSLEERLRLFVGVCQAVQHAHQKGVIHRDIKPSNILITLDYGQPVPKVIDFGIAKAIDQPLTEKTLFTHYSQMIGTPAYMSPEQAEMTSLDIDTRADVYSLGVLLYELLTGSPPFPEQRLREAGYAEMQRIIKEEEPPRPSTRLTRCEDREANWGTTSGRIRSDLDWIVMKAIEKDRRRRYGTAAGLADDVQRYLDDEQVSAVAPTWGYRCRKFARKNRRTIVVASTVLLLLLTATVLALRQAAKATRAESRSALLLKSEALAREQAQSVLSFLQEDLLAPLDPDLGQDGEKAGRNLTLFETVEQASRKLEDRFGDQPLVEASLRLTLGRAYLRLGETEKASEYLDRAAGLFGSQLGLNNPRTLEALHFQAESLKNSGRADEAVELHREVLARRRTLEAPGSHEVLESMMGLASALAVNPVQYPEAEDILHHVVTNAMGGLPGTRRFLERATLELGRIAFEQGHWDASGRFEEGIYDEQLTSSRTNSPEAIWAMAQKAYELRQNPDTFLKAEQLRAQALDRSRAVLGADHSTTLYLLADLGWHNQGLGLWGDAIKGRKEILRLATDRYGVDNPVTFWAEDLLGGSLRWFGDYAAAEGIHRRTVEKRKIHGQFRTVEEDRSLRFLVWALFHQGKVEEAESLQREVVQNIVEVYGEDTQRSIMGMAKVVKFLGAQADWPEIARIYARYAPADTFEHSIWPVGELHLPAGVIAARLSGDKAATRDLLVLCLRRYADSPNAYVREQLSLNLLPLEDEFFAVEERATLNRLAAAAVAGSADPMKRDLIAGLLARREGRWTEVAQHSSPWKTVADNAMAALAGLLHASAQAELGDEAGARKTLGTAQGRLEVGLSPGLIGHKGQGDWVYLVRWADYARSLVVRDQAEQLILGRVASPPVTPESMRQYRVSWQPTQALLDEAESHGRHGEWKAAAAAFGAAMDTTAINWEQHGNLINDLLTKAAVSFVLAGDLDHYRALSRKLVHLEGQTLAKDAAIWLICTNGLPAETIRRAIAFADPSRDSEVLGDSPRKRFQQESFRLGLARLRAGKPAEAMEAFQDASKAINLNSSGASLAYAAVAAHNSWQTARARELLNAAESAHQRVLAGNSDHFGRNWHLVAMLEAALAEDQRVASQ